MKREVRTPTCLFFALIWATLLVSMTEPRIIVPNRNVAKTWCIANPLVNNSKLVADMKVLCRVVNCNLIKPGGPCYKLNTVVDHASVVFNLWYKMHASQIGSNNFHGDAMPTVSNPSHGTCIYT